MKGYMRRILFRVFKIFIVSMLLMAIPSISNAQSDRPPAEPQSVYGERFTVKTEFASGVEMDKTLFLKDAFSKSGNIITIDSDTTDKKHEANWNILKFHNVKLSISHTETDQKQRDISQMQADDNTKLNAIKSIPNSFLTSQYRDAVQSIGKIFEPEVKLGIEF